MFKRFGIRQWVYTFLAVILAGYVAAPALAQGKGGGKGGGGGGGDTSTTSYTIFKLDDAGGQFIDGYQTAIDINDVGGVVGNVEAASDNARHAAFWQLSGGTSVLTLLNDGDFAATGAHAMNNLNEIVGFGVVQVAPPSGVALYWASPQAAPIILPSLDPLWLIKVNGINDDGIICGQVRKPYFDEDGNYLNSFDVAIVWRVTFSNGEPNIFGPVELPFSGFDFSRATALNNVDLNGMAEVIGNFGNGRWSSTAVGKWLVQSQPDGSVDVIGSPQILTLASERGVAEAWAINAKGDACGEFSFHIYEETRRATVWTAGVQIILPDPVAPKFWRPNIVHAAYDLNDSGVIVGETYLEGYPGAIVWPSATTTTPVRLSDSLPKRDSPFSLLTDATAINSAGVIVGTGWTGDGDYGYVAVPK